MVASPDAFRQGDVLAAQKKQLRLFAAHTARNGRCRTRTTRSESIASAGRRSQGRRPVACAGPDPAGRCHRGPVVGAVNVGVERRGTGLPWVCSEDTASSDVCVAVATRNRLPRMRIDPKYRVPDARPSVGIAADAPAGMAHSAANRLPNPVPHLVSLWERNTDFMERLCRSHPVGRTDRVAVFELDMDSAGSSLIGEIASVGIILVVPGM